MGIERITQENFDSMVDEVISSTCFTRQAVVAVSKQVLTHVGIGIAAPAPQYRALTLTEAAPFAELDRELIFRGKWWTLHSLTKTHARLWEIHNDDAAHVTYVDLVEQGGIWADDKTPVGVPVTTNETK